MAKNNKILRISLMGGIIGALTTNPKKALEREIKDANADGWVATHIMPHSTTNLFILVLQFAVLILTLGLFTWGGGYIVLCEKETKTT